MLFWDAAWSCFCLSSSAFFWRSSSSFAAFSAASWICESRSATSACFESIRVVRLDSSVSYSVCMLSSCDCSVSSCSFRSAIFCLVATYSSSLSRSYPCTLWTYSALLNRSEKSSELTSDSSAVASPASYIYLMRSFIAAYCVFSSSCACSRSACAWIISSPFVVRSASNWVILLTILWSCDWSEFTSLCADALLFWRSSTEGAAKTGVTTKLLVINAASILLPNLFI